MENPQRLVDTFNIGDRFYLVKIDKKLVCIETIVVSKNKLEDTILLVDKTGNSVKLHRVADGFAVSNEGIRLTNYLISPLQKPLGLLVGKYQDLEDADEPVSEEESTVRQLPVTPLLPFFKWLSSVSAEYSEKE